jgi:hypothetical protein
VFCRYIPTADYLAAELRRRLAGGVEVVAVSGRIPSSERPAIVADLARHDRRVLVATDCLSEGINLQDHFDAVVHYDLSWNPTRHEQREGRVDRFGQPRPDVRVVTYYGTDNRIDELVLKVLLRKHKTIRSSLGISVPVPGDPNAVVEAIVEGLLLRDGSLDNERQLSFEGMAPAQMRVLHDWESAAERERRSRTVFAQEGIKTDQVARELAAVRAAIGSVDDVRRFVTDAVIAHGGACIGRDPARIRLHEAPAALRDAVGGRSELVARFEGTPASGEVLLTRTHPFVSGLAAYVLDAALDGLQGSPARRAGAMRTAAVGRLTILLLLRFRFDLYSQQRGLTRQLLAEDAGVLAFTGDPRSPTWLPSDQAHGLLAARPAGNVSAEQAREFATAVLAAAPIWRSALDDEARTRADALLDSHRRVRESIRLRSASYQVEPQLPPDMLGVYVLLPGGRP